MHTAHAWLTSGLSESTEQMHTIILAINFFFFFEPYIICATANRMNFFRFWYY